jgi:hypothetical protein
MSLLIFVKIVVSIISVKVQQQKFLLVRRDRLSTVGYANDRNAEVEILRFAA